MIAKINSCGLLGVDGYIITVEVDLAAGLPAFDIVGLPDTAVRESKERVRASMKNLGINLPAKKITVNLAPANLKKEGAYLDLPIAVGILCASAMIDTGVRGGSDAVFVGELSLDGELRRIDGVLSMVISAYQNGMKEIFVPYDNAVEASVIEGIKVYGAKTLFDVIRHFTGEKVLNPVKTNYNKLFNKIQGNCLNFSDVKGQENVKRALEVAAAGGHNCLLIGPPGAGKTMISQRLPSILPAMSFEEVLEVTKVHSIAGLLSSDNPIVVNRPFRSPHHTVSAAGLSGGGANPQPGEISLAHNGVLFLDELPEFRKDALEIMRQPLEEGMMRISRASGTVSYPCSIMLVVSMNPCPCGHFGDSNRECTCPSAKRQKYLQKISGPLLDRIDLHIEVSSVKYDDIENKSRAEDSEAIRKRVNQARKLQIARYEGTGIYSNSRLNTEMLDRYCALNKDANELLRSAFESLGLSARAHNRILKVARTIADLENSENIESTHLAEAIQYRSLDRKFWN